LAGDLDILEMDRSKNVLRHEDDKGCLLAEELFSPSNYYYYYSEYCF
jgi:hypothetical protein